MEIGQKSSYCYLTGQNVDIASAKIKWEGVNYYYEHPTVGRVKISNPALHVFQHLKKDFPVLAGYCRNAFINKEDAPLITADMINEGLKNVKYSKSFDEKWRHLLKHIYKNGGKEREDFEFYARRDYPICYSKNAEEFAKIVKYLEEKYFIKIGFENGYGMMSTFRGIQMTDYGIDEIEKDMPKIPMIGLVTQEIATGDIEVDSLINQAQKLFFTEPQTMENLRNACETLAFVLEPLRKRAEKYLTVKDVDDFFQLVNKFDIRHNVQNTKTLHHPEQLEWIFYSLLNTINTYTKFNRRLER